MKVLLHQPSNFAHAERYLTLHRRCLENAGVGVVVDERQWTMSTVLELREVAKKCGAQILHLLTVDGGKKALAAAMLRPSRSQTLRTVATLHNFPRLDTWAASAFLRLLLRRRVVSRVMTPCGDRSLLPVNWRAGTFIQPSFEPIPSSMPALPHTSRRRRVLLAGKVSVEKGVREFVRCVLEVFSPAGFTGLLAGKCEDPALERELSDIASRSNGALELSLRFLSEAELQSTIRESAYIWSAYSHRRGSGIAYRGLELGTPLIALEDTVAGILVRRFSSGVCFEELADDNACRVRFAEDNSKYHLHVEGCLRASQALNEENYARELLTCYQDVLGA
jgi:hypothetical protein